MPTVEMSLAELDELRNDTQAAYEKVAQLEAEIREIEMTDPSGRIKTLTDIVAAALPVIQFAIANLDPRTIKGWPITQLHEFGTLLEKMPGATALEKELAVEFRAFANETKMIEAGRPGNVTKLTAIDEDIEVEANPS